MPSAMSEVYFIIAMMVLILVLCSIAVYFFVRQYKEEMRERAERAARKTAPKAPESSSAVEEKV